MKINYWACEYSEAEEINKGTEDETDYRWVYYCDHPDNDGPFCDLDNKWNGETEDCELLDNP